MTMNKFFLLIGILITLGITSVSASEFSAQSTQVVNGFARTCLSHMWNSDELKAKLAPGGQLSLTQLPKSNARLFLGKHSGEGWALPKPFGEAVLILRDDGVCTFFVRLWSQSDFAMALESMMDKIGLYSLKELKRVDGQKSHIIWELYPAGDHKKKIENQGLKADNPSLLMTLSTHRASNAGPQLALSLTVTRK